MGNIRIFCNDMNILRKNREYRLYVNIPTPSYLCIKP